MKETEIFISFAQEDEALFERLVKHLKPLIREENIFIRDTASSFSGLLSEQQIEMQLKKAKLILLLVSPDFLYSSACNQTMKTALKQHRMEKVQVVPIILRPCFWQGSLVSTLQTLPPDGKPITSWRNVDEAFSLVARQIELLVTSIIEKEDALLSYHSRSYTLTQKEHNTTLSYRSTKSRSIPLILMFLTLLLSSLSLLNLIIILINPHHIESINSWVLSLSGIIVLLIIVIGWQWLGITLLSTTLLGLASLSTSLHLYKVALWAYTFALNLKPRQSSAYRGQSRVYKRLGQHESAKLLRQAQYALEKAKRIGAEPPLDDES